MDIRERFLANKLTHNDYGEICKAIEKQRKVNVAWKMPFKSFGICPECGADVNTRKHKNYCGNCGQAIKWEVEA